MEYSGVLKTRKLLISRDAKNVEHGKIAPNWNVSGTRTFSLLHEQRSQLIADSRFDLAPKSNRKQRKREFNSDYRRVHVKIA